MPSKDYLMLRSARRARLEARTAFCSAPFAGSTNCLTASFAGMTTDLRPSANLCNEVLTPGGQK